jgi:hypothetical protein
MTGEREQQRVERNARREHEVLVRRAHPCGEPGEPDRDHERARAVARSSPPREHPRPDERPADQQPDGRRHHAVVGVVAVEHEREDRQPRGEPRASKGDQRQAQRGQRSLATTGPAMSCIVARMQGTSAPLTILRRSSARPGRSYGRKIAAPSAEPSCSAPKEHSPYGRDRARSRRPGVRPLSSGNDTRESDDEKRRMRLLLSRQAAVLPHRYERPLAAEMDEQEWSRESAGERLRRYRNARRAQLRADQR